MGYSRDTTAAAGEGTAVRTLGLRWGLERGVTGQARTVAT